MGFTEPLPNHYTSHSAYCLLYPCASTPPADRASSSSYIFLNMMVNNMLPSLALFALVAAQPPMPPPGVAPQCATALTEMHRTMYQSWEQWKVHVRYSLLTSPHSTFRTVLYRSLALQIVYCTAGERWGVPSRIPHSLALRVARTGVMCTLLASRRTIRASCGASRTPSPPLPTPPLQGRSAAANAATPRRHGRRTTSRSARATAVRCSSRTSTSSGTTPPMPARTSSASPRLAVRIREVGKGEREKRELTTSMQCVFMCVCVCVCF